MLGEGARTGRPGEDPRQVEHADARQRPIAVGELFRRAVADLDDLHQRQRGDRGGLRVLRPFVHGAHHAAGALRGDDRLLELERIPLRHRLAHRLAIFRHAEHAEGGGTMVREVAVQIAPAAVLGRIDAHHRVALGRHGRPVHLSCSARCGARPSPGGCRPRPPGGARCARPTDRTTARPTAASAAAPVSPMRNGVGRIGSVPPVISTARARSSGQPAIGKSVRSASLVMVGTPPSSRHQHLSIHIFDLNAETRGALRAPPLLVSREGIDPSTC